MSSLKSPQTPIQTPAKTPSLSPSEITSPAGTYLGNLIRRPGGMARATRNDSSGQGTAGSQAASDKQNTTHNGDIQIRGARQNNLKNLSLDIPTHELVVVTGVSGSGKSSLVFDTLYAEGQRRYVETFSAYARQFLDRMDKPQVDRIDGVPPAIAIDQTNPVRTSRSTVGTMTELNDHLKLLFARVATLHCRQCRQPVSRDTVASIHDSLKIKVLAATEAATAAAKFSKLPAQVADSESPSATLEPRVHVCFTVNIPANFKEEEIEQYLTAQGYTRIQERITKKDGSLALVVTQDRFRISSAEKERVSEAIEMSLQRGQGKIAIYLLDDEQQKAQVLHYSSTLHCPTCDIDYSDPLPSLFSFNSPLGACETCRGFGRVIGVDMGLVIPDESLSIEDGAVKPWRTESFKETMRDIARHAPGVGVPLDVPWNQLSQKHKDWVIKGGDDWKGNWTKQWFGIDRFFGWLESKAYKMHVRVLLSKYRAYTPCTACHGARLKPDALLWRLKSTDVGAGASVNIQELSLMAIDRVLELMHQLKLPGVLDEATELLTTEIKARLNYLCKVGLGYLTLDRQSRTLSGGEVQRINLTTALGTSLVNTLFVLDEPSMGLHPRDMARIIEVMHSLRNAGNSLVVVEHDPQVMFAADRILDIGPGPGSKGGEIVFYDDASKLLDAETLTADYLSGRKQVDIIEPRRVDAKTPRLVLEGASENNLKHVSVDIPLGRFVVLTGVSGSGKSTLLQNVLHPALLKRKGKPTEAPGKFDRLLGDDWLADVMFVDQSPIGKSSRSNPASYIGAWDVIRKRFAALDLSKERGYTAGTFSFNSGDGRCPTCGGSGFEHVEMQFLSDVYLRCQDCDGKRFRAEILEVKMSVKMPVHEAVKVQETPVGDARWVATASGSLKIVDAELSVADILELTVEQALHVFSMDKDLRRALIPLIDVGLDYLRLGQPVPTLSGGEAQRLKLAGFLAEASQKTVSELSKNAFGHVLKGGTLFMFDEPTTGLHFDDVAKLLKALRKLQNLGHSLIVIEHNLDVIRSADWIIDLGPEGGEAGGELVVAGPPSVVMECDASHTGQALIAYEQQLKTGFSANGANQAATNRVASNLLASKQASSNQLSSHLLDGNQEGSKQSGANEPGSTPVGSVMEPSARYLAASANLANNSTQATSRNADGSRGSQGRTEADEQRDSILRQRAVNNIVVHKAREHNLKNLEVEVPRNKMTVITGVSGSGKSTLAFDVIFGEGQRRYLESLNAYARQFVQPSSRPDVDGIFGIPPTVAIEQRTSRGGRKSTVATLTEIYHFLRLLYVKLGIQYCPTCKIAIEPQSFDSIAARILSEYRGQHIGLLAPLITRRKGIYTDLAKWANAKGFSHLRVDGEYLPTLKFPKIDRYNEHDIELPVADLIVDPANEAELRTKLKQALDLGKGVVMAVSSLQNLKTEIAKGNVTGKAANTPTRIFSTKRACRSCGTSFAELDPRLFSFNSKIGWCESCTGTGFKLPVESAADLAKAKRRANKQSAAENRQEAMQEELKSEMRGLEHQVDEDSGVGLPCEPCGGQRLNPVARNVLMKNESITEMTSLSVLDAIKWVDELGFQGREAEIARDVVSEIHSRLSFLRDVGLGYLSLGRSAPTLSGGEAQRIRLAAQLGSNLQGVCYVLDEPTIGLHPRDNLVLLDTLDALKAKGNTLLVVEHDEDTIRRADHIIDIGPGAGRLGGEVTATGTYAEICANKNSLTGKYLAHPIQHPKETLRKMGAERPVLRMIAPKLHNLSEKKVDIPLGALTVITGVSGSGKSTLARDLLLTNLAAQVGAKNARRGKEWIAPPWTGLERIEGWEAVERVLEVDQTPIGKTPRSCPATYIGFWDNIRRLFADASESRVRGYAQGRFSFNAAGGRCEACGGAGVQTIEMNFLPDVKVHCDVCDGQRFNRETLQVHLRGKSIGDVLKMSIDEAVDYFSAHPAIQHPLLLLQDVGLGYLTLGQPSPTLSGGEAQRIKLVTELAKVRDLGRFKPPHTLYVLDEPTVGLHMADVEKLVKVMHRLVDAGNTLVVVEHNLDVWAEADHIIDLGPEGGTNGGRVVSVGPPRGLASKNKTYTERALAGFLLSA